METIVPVFVLMVSYEKAYLQEYIVLEDCGFITKLLRTINTTGNTLYVNNN
jgi:hypothetical protein